MAWHRADKSPAGWPLLVRPVMQIASLAEAQPIVHSLLSTRVLKRKSCQEMMQYGSCRKVTATVQPYNVMKFNSTS